MEENTLDARVDRAKAKIIEACKAEDLDLVAVIEQIGEPHPSGISLVGKLSFIDLKAQPSLVVPGSENMAN